MYMGLRTRIRGWWESRYFRMHFFYPPNSMRDPSPQLLVSTTAIRWILSTLSLYSTASVTMSLYTDLVVLARCSFAVGCRSDVVHSQEQRCGDVVPGPDFAVEARNPHPPSMALMCVKRLFSPDLKPPSMISL
jgi:hypothetical protein